MTRTRANVGKYLLAFVVAWMAHVATTCGGHAAHATVLAQVPPPSPDPAQVVGWLAQFLTALQSGQWWSVLGYLLAVVPFGVAVLVKKKSTGPFWGSTYVHVALQALTSGGLVAVTQLLSGQPFSQETAIRALSMFLQSIVGFVLLHVDASQVFGTAKADAQKVAPNVVTGVH